MNNFKHELLQWNAFKTSELYSTKNPSAVHVYKRALPSNMEQNDDTNYEDLEEPETMEDFSQTTTTTAMPENQVQRFSQKQNH